jgi:hypothetical protein
MKIPMLKTSSVVVAASMLATGCAELTPGENAAVFGLGSGAAAGGIASAAGASSGEAAAIGVATGAVVAATAYIISKHQATERQRRIAEERAARAYAQHKSKMKARKTRYIAVDTEKDEHTAAGAKKSVMIWDTQSQEVVGNNVYDVKSPPAVGSTAKFDTYSAEYVGSGS